MNHTFAISQTIARIGPGGSTLSPGLTMSKPQIDIRARTDAWPQRGQLDSAMSLLRRLLGQFVSSRAILLILACGQTKLDVSIARVKIRVLVVDDEPLARERLRKLLEKEPEIELIGECADGASAVETIRSQSPDLVFLDVQMPELDGFGVLSQLERGKMPAVVFTTAHDQFALKAFEIHAVDYLLKPFGKERFQTALQRATDQVRRHHAGDLSQRLTALLADVQSEPKSKYAARIAVKSSGRVVFVKVDDLDWVEAADNYVSLHVGNEEHLHRETMAALEAQLPPAKFMRISRSTIVNVDRIKELQPLFHGEYAVILRNGAKLTLSRSYRDKLDALMGRMS